MNASLQVLHALRETAKRMGSELTILPLYLRNKLFDLDRELTQAADNFDRGWALELKMASIIGYRTGYRAAVIDCLVTLLILFLLKELLT